MRESLYNNVRAVRALITTTRTANATVNGDTVDLNLGGQNFRAAMFVIHTGTVTDGSHAVAVQDSPDGTAWAAADASEISGALPTVVAANDDVVFEVGYIGDRRHVRITVTTTASTAGATFGAVCLLGQPSSTPVTRP